MLVIVTPKAQKQYEHLSPSDQVKVKKKITTLEQNPLVGKKLSGSLSGIRSLRAWPYRILYYENMGHDRIFVITIAHRQGVYK